MASTVASSIRPGLRDRERPPFSPHTPPTRHISSVQSSPGSSFLRNEEDPVVIELDPRYLTAGFQGESSPHCCLRFTPDNSRRIGDYRTYLPEVKRRKEDVQAKCREYELWRADVKDVDLGLLEDKLERAVREAYNKHLLVDAGVARLVLVLPSLMPLPVLETIITLFFERWKYASITLLPAPAMTIAASGLRSGLVVHIGWEETVITAIYEYREVHVKRSTKSMRGLIWKMGELLERVRTEQAESIRESLRLDFDFVEEVTRRAGSCHAIIPMKEEDLDLRTHLEKPEGEETDSPASKVPSILKIEWPTDTGSRLISIPQAHLQKLCLEALVGFKDEDHLDDEEQGVSHLLYQALLSVSPDVRSICMSRIIFSGEQASAIDGLSCHILETVKSIITEYGWTAVRGKHLDAKRKGLTTLAQGRADTADARYHTTHPTAGDWEGQILKQKQTPMLTATLREVESLGPWAGASLVAALKAKSFVEIERERFLSHGLAGAQRDAEYNHAPVQRAAANKANDKTQWTLAGWG